MEFNFNENLAVDSIEKVPQDFRGLYKEKEGKFALNTEDDSVKSAVAAITKLNASLAAERKLTKKGPVDLTPLKEFGETPEDIVKSFTEKLQAAQAGTDKDAKVNLEKIKQELAQAHAKDLQSKDGKITALTNQLYSHLVEATATAAIAEAKGVPELVLPFIKNQVKVIEADGKMIPRVVDSAGDIRFSGVTGEPMTIVELVKELKANEKYGRLFESEAPSGTGSKPGAASKPTGQQPKGELSSADKIAAGLKKRGLR